MGFVAKKKAIPFSFVVLRSPVFNNWFKYMINKQSHEFLYNTYTLTFKDHRTVNHDLTAAAGQNVMMNM